MNNDRNNSRKCEYFYANRDSRKSFMILPLSEKARGKKFSF